MAQRSITNNIYMDAARDMLDFTDDIESYIHEGERAVMARTCRILDIFSADLASRDLPEASIPPARYALAMLVDGRVRQQPGVKLSTWGVLAHQKLFDGRDMSPDRVVEFQKTASQAGPDFQPLAQFLDQLRDRRRRGAKLVRHKQSHWGRITFASLGLFILTLSIYVVWLEYKFHTKVLDGFRQDVIAIGLDLNPKGPELANRLTQLKTAALRVDRAARLAPLRGVIRLPLYDSQTVAQQTYREAVEAYVPLAIVDALEMEITTQGDGLKLYDALRVWAILSGDVAWQSGFVAGWMADIEAELGWLGFSQHVQTLTKPVPNLLFPDMEAMDQARTFAAQTSEVDRVWLELKRGSQTRQLPNWIANEQVAGIDDVLLRRSGLSLDTPIAGLFTQSGWDYATDFGIGIAVQQARDIAPAILGMKGVYVNETPDLVADRLHRETIIYWQSWLADIRVQPFNTRSQAVLISGALSLKTNPLTELLLQVWMQSGGTDRSRAHDLQLQLAATFGPMIQYVEADGMDGVGRLFSALNVALGSIDVDAARGAERLVTLQDRARTIDVLKTAPLIVVQITEDVLAQAFAARDSGSSFTTAWRRNVYAACRNALEGRYPFMDGPDAEPVEVATLLGPRGAISQFFQSYVTEYIDQSASPWRWKPEARFAGLEPESAAFFERALAISQSLFNADGTMHADMTLTALAERGTTTIALGGISAAVRASGVPVELSWPGPEPARGVQVSFREATQGAQINQQGVWGLYKMLDSLRLRFRDNGQRVLVDMRTSQGRVFVELALNRPNNPISSRVLLRDFRCPPNL
ncbi:MAG: ImcF-related family protein [Litoreibacter sp.]